MGLAVLSIISARAALAQVGSDWMQKVEDYNWLLRTLESDERSWGPDECTQIVRLHFSIQCWYQRPAKNENYMLQPV